MKILVISNTPWNNQNSFGNSYSNIFSGIPDLEFANIYLSSGSPDNEFDMKCYQVTFEMLVKNLKNKNNRPYKKVENNSDKGTERNEDEQKTFDKARTLRWQIFYWARDFIWKIGRWKTDALKRFLDDFKPDLIFQPVYYSSYINDIVHFVKKYTGAPMIGYISDDCYTLKQLRFSPLYWIDRLWKRQKVKKTINMCELLYVISDIQKNEYEKIFEPECKVLTKCADFPHKDFKEQVNNGQIKIMYGGNIGTGRWKSLKLLADAVEQLYKEGYNVKFDVYSGTPRTKPIEKALNRENCVSLHEPVSYQKIVELQSNADILVHAEGLSLKSCLAVHQSFSTKLVDFFEMGKCIFAIGTYEVASIKHLKDNDAGVVAENKLDVYTKLKHLLENPETICEYGKKAYQCGEENHKKEKTQQMLVNDLNQVLKK